MIDVNAPVNPELPDAGNVAAEPKPVPEDGAPTVEVEGELYPADGNDDADVVATPAAEPTTGEE